MCPSSSLFTGYQHVPVRLSDIAILIQPVWSYTPPPKNSREMRRLGYTLCGIWGFGGGGGGGGAEGSLLESPFHPPLRIRCQIAPVPPSRHSSLKLTNGATNANMALHGHLQSRSLYTSDDKLKDGPPEVFPFTHVINTAM